jgi:hypothetical protein
LFIGGAGLGCAVLYLFLMQKSFFLFIISSIFVVATGISLAFVKIQGTPLPTALMNLLFFSISKKTFLWKRKVFSPQIIRIQRERPKETKEKGPQISISEKSQLEDLSSKLETGI